MAVFDCYDNAGGQTIDQTTVTVNLDTTRTDTPSGTFSLASDELTISETAVYHLEYRVGVIPDNVIAFNLSGDNSGQLLAAWLEEDDGSSSGYAEIDGSRVHCYAGTGSATVALSVTSGDKFRIRAVVADTGGPTYTTLADGSGLKAWKDEESPSTYDENKARTLAYATTALLGACHAESLNTSTSLVAGLTKQVLDTAAGSFTGDELADAITQLTTYVSSTTAIVNSGRTMTIIRALRELTGYQTTLDGDPSPPS